MKSILLKTVIPLAVAMCVVGAVDASQNQSGPMSAKAPESISVANRSVTEDMRVRVMRNSTGQFNVVSTDDYRSAVEAPGVKKAAGETPALIVGFMEMDALKRDAGMVSFQTDGGNSTYITRLEEDDLLFWIDNAVYADGLYYLSQSVMGNWGFLYDTKDWSPIAMNMNVDADCMPKSLAYNPVDQTVYGCFKTADKTKFDFATFDITTQQRINTIKSFGKQSFVEMAFDGEGTLYGFSSEAVGTRNSVFLYTIDTATGDAVKIGDTGIFPQAFTSAFYDFKNRHLYFSSGASKCDIYEIDPATGESTFVRTSPDDVSVRGCYVAEVMVKDDAPNMVTELTTDFEGGSLAGTLSFTLPENTYVGNPGSGAIGYKILINGQEYADVAPSLDLNWGQSVEAPVDVAELGQYTFTVMAQTDGSEGAAETLAKWIGYDYPIAPKNVTLMYDQPTLYLTWDSVQSSVHDGFIDPDKILYKVFDVDGNALTDFISECRWSVSEPNLTDGRQYNVVAYHEGLASNVANSNTVGVQSAPFRERFVSGANHSDWTIIDANDDRNKWYFDDSRETGGAYIRYQRTNGNDDYLVSPPLTLEKGKAYNLFVNMSTDNPSERFSLVMGTAPTVEALDRTILEPVVFTTSGDNRFFDCSVSVEKDGVYYIAVHAASDAAKSGNLYIYDFDLSEPLELAAPGYPTLEIEDNPERLLFAELTVGGPAKNIGGENLDNLTRYDIYRDADLVASIDNPAIGEAVKYTDAVPKCGAYNYSVIAYNEAGKGREVRGNVYVGVGIPSALSDLQVVERGNTAVLDVTWKAPSTDTRGRYIPADSVYYDVIFNGTHRVGYGSSQTSTTLEIQDLPSQKFIYFYVDPYSSAGTSRDSRVYSDMVPIGAPYEFPFVETIPSGGVQHNWSLSGTYSKWDIYNAIATPECYPQDNDGGLWGWIPAMEGDVSTLVSGKILVSGNNPTASFYYRAVSDSKSEIQVIYREIGGEWNVLKSFTLDETGKDDWVRAFVPLESINGKTVQIGFRGIAEDRRYIICIDNMYFGDITTLDAGVVSVDAPSKVNFGRPFTARAIVENSGFDAVDDALLQLVREGKVVAESDPLNLAVGDRIEVELSDETLDLFTHPDLGYQFRLVAEGDFNQENNLSDKFFATLILPKTPAVDDLAAVEDNGVVTLTWTAPDYTAGNPSNIVTEDFEDYKSWEIDRAGDWTFYDVDRRKTVGIIGITVPNSYKPAAYMLFENTKVNESYQSHIDGCKYLAAFCSQEDRDGSIVNDNWVVSPELSGIPQTVELWARTYNDYYGEESFVFLYSTGDKDINSFKELATVDGVPMNEEDNSWTEYRFDLPEGTRYFAIRHVSKDGFIFMLDDITYDAGGGDLEFIGYNVYRDGVRINESPLLSNDFVDTNLDKGFHFYNVTAVYDLGESMLSNEVSITTNSIEQSLADGIDISVSGLTVTVTGAEGRNVAVYSVDGLTLAADSGDSMVSVTVPSAGIYMVAVGEKIYKVTVK